MAVDTDLGAPGGAVYSGNTMHVGDGTWDSVRNSFLLPNIQGLNFDTMRYNGMGNRFASVVQYHQLISAHGIIAAITFLGIVPAAIFIASFYYQNTRLALRIHISLQILTVILVTVVFILGYFAVGPERSLTNPHHGIGLAIYVLILIQAIGGALLHKIEMGKMRYYAPIKLMLHQWFGRAIALLAVAQIPIGLTLYGSPLWLFVVYAIIMAAYVLLYFILTYQRHKRMATGYDEPGSYVTGTELTNETGDPAHRGRLGALAGAAAGAVGIAALRRRFSNRDSRRPAVSAAHSRVDSESYLTEKYDDDHERRNDHTWRNRILGGGAALGAVAAARKFFGGTKENRIRDDASDSQLTSNYHRPPLGGPVAPSAEHLDRLEAGLPVTDEDRWRRTEEMEAAQAAHMQQRPHADNQSGLYPAGSIGEYSEEGHDFKAHHSGPGLGTSIATIAGAVGLGGWLERRRSKKEQERIDAQKRQEREEERMYLPHEQQPLYPGDGTPRRDRVRFDPNLPGSSQYNQQNIAPVPPVPQMQHPSEPGVGVYPPVMPDPFTSGPRSHNPYAPPPPRSQMSTHLTQDGSPRPEMTTYPPQTDSQSPEMTTYPPQTDGQYPETTTYPPQPITLPPTRPPPQQGNKRSGTNILPMPIPIPMGGHDHDAQPPPPPPIHSSSMSGSPYNSPDRRSGRQGPPRSNLDPNASRHTLQQPLPVASPPHNRVSADPYSDSNVQSPAISVKLKTHTDGRHVTLRRLNEEEAAAEREARRLGRPRRRNDSFGSPGTGTGPMQSPFSQQRAESGQRYNTATPGLGQQQPSDLHLPPAQHGPRVGSAPSGIGSSPGTVDTSGPGYETGAESYDINRRRRRAERARAEQARQGRAGVPPGQRVDFE